MKPGWAYVGKNKARRPFVHWEWCKNGKVRIFLGGAGKIIDKEDIDKWPESHEDAPQSKNSHQDEVTYDR